MLRKILKVWLWGSMFLNFGLTFLNLLLGFYGLALFCAASAGVCLYALSNFKDK